MSLKSFINYLSLVNQTGRSFRSLCSLWRWLALAGLLSVSAPALAASEQDREPRLDLEAINLYAPDPEEEQVSGIGQFSDLRPEDWAYQALQKLVEQYGCVAGYPDGSFQGGRAISRYEAAALLNACLDRVTEVTDELRRLLLDLEKELALLRGRVDGV